MLQKLKRNLYTFQRQQTSCICGIFPIFWAKPCRKTGKYFISEVSAAFWLPVLLPTPGEEERHNSILDKVFFPDTSHFSSEWDLKHRLQEGIAEIAVPSASSPVKPLSSPFANTFAPIVCCLPWCQTAQAFLLLSYCFSPTLYVANRPALVLRHHTSRPEDQVNRRQTFTYSLSTSESTAPSGL